MHMLLRQVARFDAGVGQKFGGNSRNHIQWLRQIARFEANVGDKRGWQFM